MKTFNLPDRDTMLARLLKVDDTPHLQERFYPLLTKHAGEQKVPTGVVMMLALAVHDYTRGLPPMIAVLVNMNMEQFIEALIEDPELANEAKEFYKKTQK